MPRVPKWMADALEALFSGSYHLVTVTELHYLTPELKYIRFEGDFSGSKIKFVAGNVIEFRVNDTEFRHYTPSYFDSAKGICDVLFYLHNMGPGSRWAASLKEGDQLKLMGPAGKTKLDYNAENHFVFGDETSLGLMQCLSHVAKTYGKTIKCLAELDEPHMNWTEFLNIPVHIVMKSTQEKTKIALLQVDHFLKQKNRDKTAFYLTGNAKSIQTIKKHLVNSGVKTSQIQSEPYWVEGKIGL